MIQKTFRRGYATEAPVKPPKRRFRFLTYLWRATYTTTLLGTAYLGYSIYETRYPHEQVEPDPTKKTLVILGMPTPNLIRDGRGIPDELGAPWEVWTNGSMDGI